MINKVIRFSVYKPWLVIFISCLSIAAGIWAYTELPIDAVPDITNVQVQINTPCPGFAPEEIEKNVTAPIENTMSGVPGIINIRSLSRLGLSQVTLVFEDGTDIYRARQLTSERLQIVKEVLPSQLVPQLGPVTTGLGEIVHYTLIDEKVDNNNPEEVIKSQMELKSLQEWTIKPRLLTVKGVAEVNTIGGATKQYHVEPSPSKMSQYGIHFSDIMEALEKNNKNAGGGFVQQGEKQFTVQAVGVLQSIEALKKISVKNLQTLRSITLGEVADIHIQKAQAFGSASLNGQETLLNTVMMLLGENSRTVSKSVVLKLTEIQDILPKHIKIKTLYDRSELVNTTLGTVQHNLLMGASLVIIILLLLVGNLRAALITAITIPVTLILTFFVMKKFNISGNLMSLGALDFGIIVDGTVIVVDNCVRLLHERGASLKRALNKTEVKEAIIDASIEIRTAAGFGQIIVVAVFLPIFGLTGVEGKMFHPMAATFISAILLALVLSFSLTPALASLLMSGHETESEPRLMILLRNHFSDILKKALIYWKVVLAFGAASILIGGVLLMSAGAEFLPQLNEGSLVIQFVRPLEISLNHSTKQQLDSEKIIKEFAEVENVFSRVGTAEVATDPMGVNEADTFIMLLPHDQWPKINGSRRSKTELSEAMVEKLNNSIKDQEVILSQPIQMRFNDLLGGARTDLSIKIYGDDLKILKSLAESIKAEIEKVPGAADVALEQMGEAPILKIHPNYQYLTSLGIPTSEILDTVEVALAGKEAGVLFEGFRRIPIIVRLNETLRESLDAIKNLPVGMNNSGIIPLKEAAQINFDTTQQVLVRETGKRRTAVLINLRGRDTQSFVEEAKKIIKDKIKVPDSYVLEWAGNYKNLQQAKDRMAVLTPLALILVMVMVFMAFKSLKQTMIVLSCIPLALSGGIIALIAYKLPMSISAGIGFIALAGISVLNGVVLVNVFNDLKHKIIDVKTRVYEGTLLRLRPVLMTALVDIFGFLPMMLSSGIGSEVQKPLATVVIGGVISSTILTLILLPVLYYKFMNNELKGEQS